MNFANNWARVFVVSKFLLLEKTISLVESFKHYCFWVIPWSDWIFCFKWENRLDVLKVKQEIKLSLAS